MIQPELFSAFEPDAHIARIIDEALFHVEKQDVLRRFLAGQSWGAAFGLGGSYWADHGPAGFGYGWMGDAKGITITLGPQEGRVITPSEIMERARQYERTL